MTGEVTRFSIAEFPVGRAVYWAATSRFSGTAFIKGQDGSEFSMGFANGVCIDAVNSHGADSPVSVAVAMGLLLQSEARSAMGVLRSPGTEPGWLRVARHSQMGPTDLAKFAHASTLKAAARAFSCVQGTIEMKKASKESPEGFRGLDPRQLVWYGVSQFAPEEYCHRLMANVQSATISSKLESALPAFGFGAVEQKIAQRAVADVNTVLGEPGSARVLFALLCCGYLKLLGPTARGTDPNIAAGAKGKSSPKGKSSSRKISKPSTARELEPVGELGAEVESLFSSIEQGLSLYTLLGLEPGANEGAIQKAYFGLAKRLHPDKVHAAGNVDRTKASRVFAEVNRAFATLSNPKLRAEYQEELAAGGKAALRAKRLEEEKKAEAIFEGERSFAMGQMELKRKRYGEAIGHFKKSLAVNQEDGLCWAQLGWATWCDAKEKKEVYSAVIEQMERSVKFTKNIIEPYLYLGRIHDVLGDAGKAKENFEKVLKMQPSHSEASMQLRLYASRQKK